MMAKERIDAEGFFFVYLKDKWPAEMWVIPTAALTFGISLHFLTYVMYLDKSSKRIPKISSIIF